MLYVHVLYVHVLRACGAYLFWSIKITTLGIDVNQLSLIMSSKFACVGRAVTECVTVCVAECVVGTFGRLLRGTFGRLLRGILKNGSLAKQATPRRGRSAPGRRRCREAGACVCISCLSLSCLASRLPLSCLSLSCLASRIVLSLADASGRVRHSKGAPTIILVYRATWRESNF